MAATKRVALYLRVSTTNHGQSTDNQRRELQAVAARSGWSIVAVYKDNGISGARGRDRRPGLDAMMKAATRRQFDLIAAWSVDRLGRSLQHLVHLFSELQALGVDLYLHQQSVDSSTPAGKALLQMSAVFSEFERAMLLERTRAGLARARASGKRLGRPRAKGATDARIRALRAQGMGMVAIAKRLKCGGGTVMRALGAMNYPVTRFTSLAVALKEIEPFIRNGGHLQTGKPFKKFGGMRSRELLANWLLCVAINSVSEGKLTFSSDPIGGDGIICDDVTGETWPTEHVMVPRLRAGQTDDAEALILKAVEQKRGMGGAAYAGGKTLIVFLDAGAGTWLPNKVARQLPKPLHFTTVWVVGLQRVEAGEYVYGVTNLDVSEGQCPDTACAHQKRLRRMGSNSDSVKRLFKHDRARVGCALALALPTGVGAGVALPGWVAGIERAEALRPLITEMRGRTLREIADELNARSISTASGQPWTSVGVLRVQRRLGLARS
jgi:DNA invertase Pin-like site-specific DNA recombinase